MGYSLKHGVRGRGTGMLKGFEVHFHQFWFPNGLGFEIVPGILMTTYFCDGMTMGCFADENENDNNNRSSFQ